MTRYYYTCPIKALYMMKEFGVEFETYHQSKIDGRPFFFKKFNDMWVNNVGIDDGDGSVRLVDLLYCKDESKTRVNDKIYVSKESEHIFEPKTNDIFSYKMFGRVATYILPENQDGKEWAKEASEIKIIMRDDKEFFMAEVENDQKLTLETINHLIKSLKQLRVYD